jgi:hypothetical protein
MVFENERLVTDAFFAKNATKKIEVAKAKKDDASTKGAKVPVKDETYVYPGGGYDYEIEPKQGRKMMQLPRDFEIMDQLRVNGENLIERTTMGGIFYEMIVSIKKWVKMLALSIFTFIISVLLFINGLHLFGAVTLVMAFYYYGQYDIWIDRSQMHKQFSCVVPH